MAGVGTNPLYDPVWQQNVADGASNAVVAAGAGTTVIKAGAPGRLCKVVITTAGTTGNLSFYDGSASGNLLAVVPGTTAAATALVGTIFIFSMPFLNGLVAVGAANSPGVSLSYV